MTKEQMDAIRARYLEKIQGPYHAVEFLANIRKDIPALLDALDKAQTDVEERIQDRDIWIERFEKEKARAEALEKGIKSLGGGCACVLCARGVCEECNEHGNLYSWRFDIARFSKE